MHPAGSVIIFTVASGLGFGLLTWLGLGFPNVFGWEAFFYYGAGFALAGGGLLIAHFIPLVILVLLMFLEFMVALIQAYIFTILTCLYLNDAINLH